MGKSGGRKKKGSAAGANQALKGESNGHTNSVATPNANGGIDLNSLIFLKRAHELKEEGNKRFQNKDFAGALEQYDNALRLTPKTHPDRAVFHSNRAACLMQMKPIDYETVISECTMALQVQPQFVRALLRRARAYEAIGKLRTAFGPRQEAQQDLQSRPSPAALGASAVRGAPIGGLGPCLPARPVSKKAAAPSGGSIVSPISKMEKPLMNSASENGPETKNQLPKLVLKPSSGSSKASANPGKDRQGKGSLASSLSLPRQVSEVPVPLRPLKLVYDHDIRLAQMPVNCAFKVLREIVSKRFSSSKSVLIKYKDTDGDLVTITCTTELRLAESSVDSLLVKEPGKDNTDSVGMLRLHVVEVSPEQEPPLLEEEEEEEEEKPPESEENKGDESGSHSSLGESVSEVIDTEINKAEKETTKEKLVTSGDPESREVEMDDWLFEFAQLFRTHVGIDPDAHIDLHELGMELCSEALEETVTSEEAQRLFDKAASKFQEVAALAFFNWGNVHMCAARKRIPLDESAGKEVVSAQLQTAYEWVKDKYSLAREKYEEALLIKPDFYEGLLALGQQQFEMAKLHWSFVLAKKIDLSSWDSAETLKLFDSAEEKMKVATDMWEKIEEQKANELKDPNASKKDEMLRRKKKQGSNVEGESSESGAQGEISPEEAAEQAAVMRSQIHLFWGNMLFERSQVECKLGMDGWKRKLDAAVERFRLAGASEADISMVLKNHCSNGDAVEGDDKKVQNSNTDNVSEADKSEEVNKA
ncbi:PROTEIN CLMP1 [Salix viminalis]|uniref:PROTEIN CLMP1 n=1 Tax=Salix viminalis TaxID=40686 RepID=A0A9Q0Z8K7_SALVM|nr:PROTEIN CLMP1 [Salix viminalis]